MFTPLFLLFAETAIGAETVDECRFPAAGAEFRLTGNGVYLRCVIFFADHSALTHDFPAAVRTEFAVFIQDLAALGTGIRVRDRSHDPAGAVMAEVPFFREFLAAFFADELDHPGIIGIHAAAALRTEFGWLC